MLVEWFKKNHHATEIVYKDTNPLAEHPYVVASYSTQATRPEILLFPCNGLGNVTNWLELGGDCGGHLTPRDIPKIVYEYNQKVKNNDPTGFAL